MLRAARLWTTFRCLGGGRAPVWNVPPAAARETSMPLSGSIESVILSLDKNRTRLGGTTGIHPAILMNCAAQAALNAASEAAFSLPIRCSFYLVAVGKRTAAKKGHGSFPLRQETRPGQAPSLPLKPRLRFNNIHVSFCFFCIVIYCIYISLCDF